jgi:hypothetical protein
MGIEATLEPACGLLLQDPFLAQAIKHGDKTGEFAGGLFRIHQSTEITNLVA